MPEKYGYIVPMCDPAEAITPPSGHRNIFVNLSGNICTKDPSGTVSEFLSGPQVITEGSYFYAVPTANIGQPLATTNGNVRYSFIGGTKLWLKEERISGTWEPIAENLD